MEDTFAQIEGAAQHSIGDVRVDITQGGSIKGQGVTASADAVRVCGGNLDNILRSFGGIEGGDTSFGGKASSAVKKSSVYASKLGGQVSGYLENLTEYLDKLKAVQTQAVGVVNQDAIAEVVNHIRMVHDKVQSVYQQLNGHSDIIEDMNKKNQTFISAIKSLGANLNESTAAGMLSLAFTSINDLKDHAANVQVAIKKVESEKSELSKLDEKLCRSEIKNEAFVAAWKSLMASHGHDSKLGGSVEGGALSSTKLVDRLTQSRNELKTIINKFIDAFAGDINGMCAAAEAMAAQFGKDIDYDEKTVAFLAQFDRLSEYLSDQRKAKIYQHLLELNIDQIDSKEIKDRFLSTIRVLAECADAVDSTTFSKEFAKQCREVISNVNKYSDMVKSHRDVVKKEGGSTDSMNELFSVDASKIDINGLITPLERLKVVITKIKFFRNIAIFRSNLRQTNKELAVYSKDYPKSVGKAIGEVITKIKNEYTDIINQIGDNKSGMGLEIDMYNESSAASEKISKEKLKMIYKWQCDARIGLYKTVEAIDLYLLHFTDAITKNPDAVSDLHKMLSATKIIAKWYDTKAGDNLIRVFESFAAGAKDSTIDGADFIATYNALRGPRENDADYNGVTYADISGKLSGDRATRVYERCRRAIEGVVVLKNIISYFITISEKYGDFKSEKNIYMAPSNIYKNLVNYIWVSAIDANVQGTEILTDNNEVKRIMSFEDTKVSLATVNTSVDPETFGINFSKHSMDKLRIMKCHQELTRLREFMASMGPEDIGRLKQFVTGTFARLGKTEYIFYMVKFGVYDLSLMDSSMIRKFMDYLNTLRPRAEGARGIEYIKDGVRVPGDDAAIVAELSRVPPAERSAKISITINGLSLKTLSQFQSIVELKDLARLRLIGLDLNGAVAAPAGFLEGFLQGVTGSTIQLANVTMASRVSAVLHNMVMDMVNKYKTNQQGGVFAIDDTYFVLTIKAIAGKVMAITGVNRLLKDPKQYNNIISKNQARLIMGGAEGDVDVIDEAVELYVRLPLLVEFYRSIFDDGNKKYINDDVNEPLDDERVSYVPEIGNVWSGLIINIFEKSKHIENGVYTPENMRKIVSEINSIYKHYKGSVNGDELTRHIVLELVAEINRRYGVIKRQELLQYYRVVNATKRANFNTEFNESNYTTNDLDILNEAMEFEEKSPSEEFINLKQNMKDPSIPVETKINRLTDYKILKDFRQRIDDALTANEYRARVGEDANGTLLTIVDRVRLLKKAIVHKSTRQEKYDMIIKAIEESDSMNQSSNEIFTCFHEFVIMPLRTAYQMHHALEMFIGTMYAIIEKAEVAAGDAILDNSNVTIDGVSSSFRAALTAYNTNAVNVAKARAGDAPGSQLLIAGDENLVSTAEEKNYAPLGLLNTLTQFATNSGELVKLNISITNRIAIDFSEYQRVCEYLVAHVKYMVDKFTGVIPSTLIERITSADRSGGLYFLEKELINGVFNKINKSEKDRTFACIDNVNKLMPIVSKIVFENNLSSKDLIEKFVIHKSARMGGQQHILIQNTIPVVRDSFMTYNRDARMYTIPTREGLDTIQVSKLLFNPTKSSLGSGSQYGFIQQFNTLISAYLNDMYDAQSRKIYTKTFATFSSSALIDALNGQSFPDFGKLLPDRPHYTLGASRVVLSSTLAFVMKTLLNRVHPTTGVKLHEVTSLQDVSPHVLEKYRMLIPMYLRVFKAFLARCKVSRKVVGKMNITDDTAAGINFGSYAADGHTQVREFEVETDVQFANNLQALNPENAQEVKDAVTGYLDEIVSGVTSLIQDIQNVQTELLETDSTVPLYFDTKKDFTKNYMASAKELPFAPLSVLAMGFAGDGEKLTTPLYNSSDIVNNKFLYGIRSLLMNDFKISSKTVPYLKKLVDDFNGYNTSGNAISEKKFNDVLTHVGQAVNYIYDLRFFNGRAISHCDPLKKVASPPPGYPATYQEMSRKGNSLTIIESVNVIDSSDKIATHVKTMGRGPIEADIPIARLVAPAYVNRNPRDRVIMVNIIDLNIMPINVHSLMREIPLANLYNYAMTFDSIVNDLALGGNNKKLLLKPYQKLVIQPDAVGRVSFDMNGVVRVQAPEPKDELRFVEDVLNKRILKLNNGTITNPALQANAQQRINTKIFRNLTFLALVQHAIKTKVKSEIEFINTRVVSNVAAVSNTITNAATDLGPVTENLFEF